MRLKGRHAIVTGGGTGIGAAIAHAMALEGANLTLIGRRKEKLEKISASIPRSLVAPADVTDRNEVDRAFSLGRETHGPISILINNAGAAESAPFAEVEQAQWQRMMAVNLDALFHCCQAAIADLAVGQSTRIVTVSSVAGLKGYAYTAPYVAAKHGAIGLTRALAAEYAQTDLTVNAVCPGFTETDLLQEAVSNIQGKTGRSLVEARAELARFNPQRRLVTRDEVASAVLWLCLPENGAMNGQAIAVAGGEVT